MRRLRTVVDSIYLVLIYFGILSILAMIIIVALNVFSRLLFNETLGWADEVALVLMVWFSMIGVALGVKLKLHIAIELFTAKLPENIKRSVINRVGDAAALILGTVMFFYGIALVRNGMSSTLPATQWPTSAEYIFVPVAGFLIIIDSLADFIGIERGDALETAFSGGEEND